jgi:hypothetical protein
MHSDGIVEAHTPDRDMYGFPRLKALTAEGPPGAELIDRVLADAENGSLLEQIRGEVRELALAFPLYPMGTAVEG